MEPSTRKSRRGRVALAVILVAALVMGFRFVAQMVTWRNMDTTERLDHVTARSVDNKKVFGSLVKIESKDGAVSYEAANGNLSIDDAFSIASITKMFTASIIFQLVDEEQMELTDTLDKYLTHAELEGLHYHEGVNHGPSITIQQLLSHTSGLPDYFSEKVGDTSILEEIVQEDRLIEFEEMLSRTKSLEPHFVNGSPGKAYYADINYDILGVIAERVTKKDLEEIYFERIFDPLELEQTSLATVDSGFTPIYLHREILDVPLAKASFRASGAIISNLDDLMTFLRAFNEGRLFSISSIASGEWNEIQFDFHEYQNGVMRFRLTGVQSVFGGHEIIGHSGLTGSFAFYCPNKELFMVGTTNQMTDPALQYRLMYQLLDCINDD